MPKRAWAVAALLVLLAAPSAAHAAFAGRNGQLVYEGKKSPSGFLYVRSANGKSLHRLLSPARPEDPAVSPQGLRVAFGTSDGKLWISYVDGKALRQLVTGVTPSRSPSWSPRGDGLAFAGGRRGARDLFTIAADGHGLRPLTFGPEDEFDPAWSSKDQLAFVRRSSKRGKGDIFTMPAGGGRARRLTRGPADDESPAWSPSGNRIAFTRVLKSRKHKRARAQRNQSGLYVMRGDGKHLRRFVRSKGGITSPAWSPNGRWIAFGMGRKGRRALYVVRNDGHRLRRVVSGATDARAIDWQPTGADPVVAAAGDIACDPGEASFAGGVGTDVFCHQLATSDLLLERDFSAVFALGDNQYENGTFDKYMGSFNLSWGRMKDLIHPVIGNHEARDPNAAGYYGYFNGPGKSNGPAGPTGRGYYSLEVGTWHVVVLNSECSDHSIPVLASSCAPGSAQEQWLRADLASHKAACTLALWHHPLISSGLPSLNTAVQPLWQDLYAAGADVVLTGHDHSYERFAPTDATATRDPARGLRQFVVGTGGKNHQVAVSTAANSELREDGVYGVLEMTLRPHGYDWEFVAEGGRVLDSGANACH